MGHLKTILVASGASGGHLFPALAVAKELQRQGWKVRVVLGGNKFSDVVERAGIDYTRLPAAAFNDRGIFRLLWACVRLLGGTLKAFRLMMREKPAAVFGTGGYATVATLLAARVVGVPTIIHEQNVLPGRANRLLAKLADKVVLTFEETRKYFPCQAAKLEVGGTPLREEVLELVKAKRKVGKVFRILVLGGSQGARILGEVVPEMVALMTPTERKDLFVVQQVRPDDAGRVAGLYGEMGLGGFEVASFFNDLPQRYLDADLLIGRSGVGTVLEAATLGLPAVYVPLELADGHQKLNAGVAEQAGAAVVVEQPYFTPANLLVHVKALRGDPQRLEAMGAAARKLARPHATRDVVKMILAAAKRPDGKKSA